MKTKLFVLALMATLSLSVSAGTFLKTEAGQVSWTVNLKDKKGSIQIYTHTQGYDSTRLDPHEQQRVIFLPMSFGRSIDLPMNFELSDERSQETVEAYIVTLMKTELAGLPTKVLDSDVELQSITCLESGVFKKKLKCSTLYKAKLTVEFTK